MEDDRLSALERANATHAVRLDNLERQDDRTRQRLHELEGDRAAVRHMTKLAGDVFETAKQMQLDAKGLVEESATRAVDKAFRRRRELAWQSVLRVTTVISLGASVLYGIIALLHG